jgi:subtilisin family serine protease
MKILVASLAAAATVAGSVMAVGMPATAASTSTTEYVVLAASAADTAKAAKAAEAAGGTVVEQNSDLGYVVARSNSADFTSKVDAHAGVVGAARNRVIGEAPKDTRASKEQVEKLLGGSGSAKVAATGKGKLAEPLSGLQWDMKMIDATPSGSYSEQLGSKRVLVGIIDTGVDGTHPDIKPNFNQALSRNFTTDIPDPNVDGPCEHPSCVDPVNEDDNGHGTHVASTIGSPINGLGMAGVAPNVTLVNIRAGQDSGFFFLKPTLDALTYAGKIGVDVVNMSYYTDPWLYNCTANPADSPAQQQEQRVIIEATQRALYFARHHGVLPVAAEGNENTDLNLDEPIVDDTSPDYPLDTAYPRTVDDSCIDVPAESEGVVTVSSIGPSGRLAYYSNYGTEETDVSAPGGDVYDNPENTRQFPGGIIAAYPKNVAEAEGTLNPDGTPNTPAVIRDCKGSVCAYYQYLQGTSMASPHAVGVAALIVSEYGHKYGHGITLSPRVTQRILYRTAEEHACPDPATVTYTRHRPDPFNDTVTSTATCEGTLNFNGFYGHGIVNALAAVS